MQILDVLHLNEAFNSSFSGKVDWQFNGKDYWRTDVIINGRDLRIELIIQVLSENVLLLNVQFGQYDSSTDKIDTKMTRTDDGLPVLSQLGSIISPKINDIIKSSKKLILLSLSAVVEIPQVKNHNDENNKKRETRTIQDKRMNIYNKMSNKLLPSSYKHYGKFINSENGTKIDLYGPSDTSEFDQREIQQILRINSHMVK